ncbi:uncharacterized protein [Drosophila virilis]|uniref:Uncharacterized protein, isoform A n=1 Tax=Drosophila virilis TaxID=7244 RepID=B4LZP0_DROVI|nr:uncharacterized protein LOC6629281 isoform X1 [Drosophila virilis]EDW68209.2 uncharacterized protein Dvir_GJ22667, isoform A [Drosophila virilis]
MASGDVNDPQLAFIRDQVQLCMLPSLKKDLDEVQVLPAHFEAYHSMLKQELPELYDLLQRHEDVLLNDILYQELRAQLVLLFCELTASQTIYSLDAGDAKQVLQNANQILSKLASICQKAEESYIFNYYERNLHKDCWKRQLGAVHGYVRYLEIRYANDVKMSAQMLTFSLAVGLNVRECYQSEYKQLGVRIFTHMLKHGRSADIQQLNVQGVIYEHVFRDVQSMDTIAETNANWDCLCLCLDHLTELDAFSWNQCDDMLERLIQNVSLASSTEMSICLMQIITKLGYYFAINKDDIKSAIASDLTQPNQMVACLEVCASLNVCTNFRWAKSILHMLVLESEKLLRSAEACAQMLAAMQRCFLVCVLSIPLQALHMHLGEFYAKFVAVLLESIVVHERTQPILGLTQQFFQIFIYQLKNCPSDHQAASNLKSYLTALENLPAVIVK